jgi:hypothetical protein
MATGGIFQLITNDGKQDRMLMATALLSERLKQVGLDKATLYDIEKTHILFTNAHFKPFAAIGYEYNKVTSTSGSPTFGSNVQFSIPQFGDFFNDMIVHAVLSQPTLGSAPGVAISNQNLCRWANYPGERLLNKVKFEVNGNPLDEYYSDAANFHREFMVQPGNQVGWNRCVGQEETEEGYVEQPTWLNSNVIPNDIKHRVCASTKSGNQTPTGSKFDALTNPTLEMFIPLLFWMNKDPRLSIPSVAIPYGQRFVTVELCKQYEIVGEVPRGTGNWNATDLSTNGSVNPVTINTLELYINNIFVNPDVHNIFIKRIGFTLIRVHRRQIATTKGGVNESVLLSQLKWPIETMYVGVRPLDYNSDEATTSKRHLDKWHRFCNVKEVPRVNQGWLSTKVSKVTAATTPLFATALALNVAPTSFTFAIAGTAGDSAVATLVVGGATAVDVTTAFKPGAKFSATFGTNKFTGVVDTAVGNTVVFEKSVYTTIITGVVPGGVVGDWFAGTGLTGLTIVSLDNEPTSQVSKVDVFTPTVTALTIKAHGIPIYNNFPGKFYNSYIPYNYGGHHIRTPADPGAMLITFCLYPGTYQPSGHINVSRAREFYIEFTTSSDITVANPGTLIVVACAINFLLISDGSAVLRYST